MWRDILSLLGVAIAIYSSGAYIRTILAGESKPHRVTWGGWTLVGVLGIVSSVRGGAGVGLFVTTAFALGVAAIFFLSCFPKYGKPGGSRIDFIAGLVAAVALLTQLFIDYSPNLGQVIALSADLIFFWPTLREAWKHPEYEAVRPWAIGASGELLGLIALGNYSFGAAAYSAYIFLGNVVVVLTLLVSKDSRGAWQRVDAPKAIFRRRRA